MVVLTATVVVQEGQLEAALNACRTVRGPSQQEAGCLRYDFYQLADDSQTILFYEEWTSRESLDEHFQEPHFLTFASLGPSLFTKPAEIRIYEIASYEDLG